ncbi:MAG: hypothetical protein K0U20_08320 [Proteobacteria bacterium]|nr:hypothetical protein [Pseudomonadota bacterium]
MKRIATWKTATLSAALIGLNLFGAGAAMASPADTAPQAGPATISISNEQPQPHQSCNTNGVSTSVCRSPGDASIVTAPNPNTSAEYTGPFGAGIGGH